MALSVGIARADAGAVAQGVGHRPPDVGLAVGHAAALEDERVVVLLGVAGQLLGQPRLADAGLAEQEQQRRPGVADGVLHAVAQQAELRLAADEPRPVALGPVARAGRRRRRPARPAPAPRGPWRRSARAPRSGPCDGWRRRWPGPRAPRPAGRRPAGGWRCSRRRPSRCSRRRRGARPRAPRRCSRRRACGCRRRARRCGRPSVSCMRSAARTARSASSSWAVGRAEQRDDGVADDLVDAAAEGVDVGDEPLEAPVDEVLHLLRVARSPTASCSRRGPRTGP